MSKRKKSYSAAPSIPPELLARYEAILKVQTGEWTVSEAARTLGLARNHFQTLMHRGLAGLLDAITPKPPGRPARPPREAELEEKLDRLEHENARLRQRTEMIDRLLDVAGGVIRGEIRTRTRAATTKSTPGDDPGQQVAAVDEMRSLGLPAPVAAAVAGTSAATMRRWHSRMRQGVPLRKRRGPAPRDVLTPEQVAKVEAIVRECSGLIGADALRHRVKGVSRRAAARIKARAQTKMEADRKAACMRIHVTVPGVIRGFDAIEPRGRTSGASSSEARTPACRTSPACRSRQGTTPGRSSRPSRATGR